MPLAAGTRLGSNYEITGSIGAGGMGEVYRATDIKLKREVALKVLPDAFARDANRMTRFQREAELLAALNHPNIAAIYGLEESDGRRALIMELVEGETLAERIQRGPIPAAEALQIARQIAAGLEYAHEKGIVHRDLKPANVKITDQNSVKILDFGLAKALSDDRGSTPNAEDSPTMTMGTTQAGVILGTATYMSPEQARGKAVDKRADIWAFGVVLYEMLTGKRPFRGEGITEILAAVIKEEPAWSAVPVNLRPLLQRCLEKNPAHRLRDIGDAMCLVDLAPVEAPPVHSQSRPIWLWAAAAFFLIAAAATPFAVAHLREKPPAHGVTRFEVPPPPKGAFDIYMALSPDGRRLAFTGVGADGVVRIWLRDLESVEAHQLAGTENVASLIWSPDSRFIAFGSGSQLKKVDIGGGSPVKLCDSATAVGSGAWSPNGVIVFGGRGAGAVQKVSEAGGVASPVTALDPARGETYHSFPAFLPDGRHFVYLRNSATVQGIYAGSLDSKPSEQSSKLLFQSRLNAVYAPAVGSGPGDLLFVRDGTLMAQPFDASRLELAGEPAPVAEQVGSTNTYGNYSVSQDGTLAYRVGAPGGQSELAWMDRTGKRLATVAGAGVRTFEALSPDEKTVAYVQQAPQGGGTSDLWLYDIARGTNTRFTFGPGLVTSPVWSPDSRSIAYGATAATATYDIYRKPASGAAKEELVLKAGDNLRLSDWSRDGKTLVYVSSTGTPDVWMLPMEGEHKPAPYLQAQFYQFNGQLSPDGRWMAYTSNETGEYQIYVQPVPATGAKWQVSVMGGDRARWRRDGKELFYIGADQRLMAVAIKAGSTFEAAIPQPLFPTPVTFTLNNFQFFYTPSADGQKFLLRVPVGAATPSPITVVLNWRTALSKPARP